MNKIKKGDEVIAICGKDKGRKGTVAKVDGNKLIVEGLNMVKKHVKGDPNRGIEPGVVDKEMPIHVSNVMIFNPQTEKGDRVGFRTLEDGTKVRFFKSNGETVDA